MSLELEDRIIFEKERELKEIKNDKYQKERISNLESDLMIKSDQV